MERHASGDIGLSLLAGPCPICGFDSFNLSVIGYIVILYDDK